MCYSCLQIVIHPYQNKKTAQFVDLINSRDNATKSISSFILVDDDFNRDVSFDSGIMEDVSVARMDTIYGNTLKDHILLR